MTPLNAMTALWARVPLAEDIPDPNDVRPGWIGFVVVVVLALAVVVLLLSFRKQLKKVDFEQPAEKGAENGGENDGGSESADKP
jgi:hypothetical protein